MEKRGILLPIVAALLIVAPVLLLGWMRLRTEDQLADIQPPPQAVLAQVTETAADDAQSAVVSITWGEAPAIPAPAWSGTVTAVHVASGDRITTGTSVLAVDGVDRLAASTPSPFWRVLNSGTDGDDVSQLQELLMELGYYGGEVNGSFDAALADSVNALGSDLGANDSGGVFDPAWLLWMPEDPFEALYVQVRIGDSVPAQGTAVILGRPPISSIALLNTDTGETLSLVGAWNLEVLGELFPLADGQLNRDALRRLAVLIPAGKSDQQGQVSRTNPRTVIEIAAAAVTSNSSGALCVWVPDGSSFVARPIESAGGGFGRVRVAEGLEAGDSILVNPSETLGSVSCP